MMASRTGYIYLYANNIIKWSGSNSGMDNVTDSSGVFVILTIKSGMKIWQDSNFASLTTAQIANAARWRKFRPCSCNDSLIQPARDINCKSCMNLDVKQNVHNLKLLVWCFLKISINSHESWNLLLFWYISILFNQTIKYHVLCPFLTTEIILHHNRGRKSLRQVFCSCNVRK